MKNQAAAEAKALEEANAASEAKKLEEARADLQAKVIREEAKKKDLAAKVLEEANEVLFKKVLADLKHQKPQQAK